MSRSPSALADAQADQVVRRLTRRAATRCSRLRSTMASDTATASGGGAPCQGWKACGTGRADAGRSASGTPITALRDAERQREHVAGDKVHRRPAGGEVVEQLAGDPDDLRFEHGDPEGANARARTGAGCDRAGQRSAGERRRGRAVPRRRPRDPHRRRRACPWRAEDRSAPAAASWPTTSQASWPSPAHRLDRALSARRQRRGQVVPDVGAPVARRGGGDQCPRHGSVVRDRGADASGEDPHLPPLPGCHTPRQ